MKPPRLTEIAHEAWAAHVRHGDTVIDATAGNGHDTRALLGLVGRGGQVYAFDIQMQAVGLLRGRMDEAGNLHLHQACHSRMAEYIPRSLHGRVSLVAFNLGYLPHGDKGVTTCAETTVAALDCALGLLSGGGLLSVVAYRGHAEGQREYEAVRQWQANLDGSWEVTEHCPEGAFRQPPPVLFLVRGDGTMNGAG